MTSPTKRSLERAREIFKSCILTNFCSCDCHKSMSIPGSVVNYVAQALDQAREEALDKAAKVAEGFRHLPITHDNFRMANAIRELKNV